MKIVYVKVILGFSQGRNAITPETEDGDNGEKDLYVHSKSHECNKHSSESDQWEQAGRNCISVLLQLGKIQSSIQVFVLDCFDLMIYE